MLIRDPKGAPPQARPCGPFVAQVGPCSSLRLRVLRGLEITPAPRPVGRLGALCLRLGLASLIEPVGTTCSVAPTRLETASPVAPQAVRQATAKVFRTTTAQVVR